MATSPGNAIGETTTGITGFTGTAFTGTPVTQYNVQVGGSTSSTLANVAPSATSGVPLISQGASSNPAFGTAVVAGGGTGQVTLTNHGVLIGQATSAIAATAAGSAGQVLQSGGASADPTYSTATYPSTATGTGKILRADGTNWVATTATYPDTAGTSGNVLTSNGTNWVSSAPAGGGLTTIESSLTNAQIKALHGTPVQIIAAPGSGKSIQIMSAALKLNYGGTNVFTAAGGTFITITYGTSTALGCNVLSTSNITASSNQIGFTNGLVSATASAATNIENVAVNIYNTSATEIAGNAANDNTITYSVTYRIANL